MTLGALALIIVSLMEHKKISLLIIATTVIIPAVYSYLLSLKKSNEKQHCCGKRARSQWLLARFFCPNLFAQTY